MDKTCAKNFDLENHRNLTAMWRAIGARPVPALAAKGGMLADAFPNRVWLSLKETPSGKDLDAINRVRAARRVLLPLWGAPSLAQEELLRGAGFEAVLTQTAMSLELNGRIWEASEGVGILDDRKRLPNWTAAVSAAFGYDFDPAVSRRLFDDPDATLFVAFEGDLISGTGVVYRTGTTAGVHWVGVVPAFRRRGVARAVMNRILGEVSDCGLSLVTLQASAAGLRLYESLGFAGRTTIHSYQSAP